MSSARLDSAPSAGRSSSRLPLLLRLTVLVALLAVAVGVSLLPAVQGRSSVSLPDSPSASRVLNVSDDSGSIPPEGSGSVPPEGSGSIPPEGSGSTPPEGSGSTPPEGSGSTPPEGSGSSSPGDGSGSSSSSDPEPPAPAPVILDFSPKSGPQHGGTLLTVTGINLDVVSSVTIAGNFCSNVRFSDGQPEKITCMTGPAPQNTVAPVRLLFSEDEHLDSVDDFTYHNAPQVTSITPTLGPKTGDTVVTLKAYLPADDPVVAVRFDNYPCEYLKVSTSEIECITPRVLNAGQLRVYIVTEKGGSSSEPIMFTFLEPPVVSSISPSSGPMSGGTRVNIVGEHFGSTTDDIESITLADVPCKSITLRNSTHLSCTSGASSNSIRGNVIVTNVHSGPGGSKSVQFTYNLGPLQGGTTVTISGHLLGDSLDDILLVTLAGLPCLNVQIANNGDITCTSSPSAEPLSGPVIVTTRSGGASDGEAVFTYNLPPHVRSVTPDSGPQTGNTQILIVGESLGQNRADVLDVTVGGISCFQSLEYVSPSQLKCFTPANGVSGPVVVTTASGGSGKDLDNAIFTYMMAPRVLGFDPAEGLVSGFTLVQIRGDFLGTSRDDIADVIVAGHSCLYSLTFISSNHITCVTPTAFGSSHGPVTVITYSGGIDCRVGIVSCAAFIGIMLLVVLLVVIGIATYVLIYYVNRDDELKKQLKNLRRDVAMQLWPDSAPAPASHETGETAPLLSQYPEGMDGFTSFE
ncbi:hypothetical protein H696_04029 [Fonticula alba]|uniref:IPT/TIG domain-containing protein n=1 Tax=Fonticula alba TaxID=691883 RepID=A0A058Z5S5_FONAL|nr:hypothetical protein H696_04029 [Fonticula alba]KCV69610.1 hypothetical protein H696_04029 [Fonticula alba]|eukprot:XP_009496175.1 hypothetical protein H696_04029 [Fonticula alba]